MKDKFTAYTGAALMLIGTMVGIGSLNEWAGLALLIPFTWLFIGMFFDWLINGKNGTKTTVYFSSLSVFIVANVAFITLYRDTSFVVGRLMLVSGYILYTIRMSRNGMF